MTKIIKITFDYPNPLGLPNEDFKVIVDEEQVLMKISQEEGLNSFEKDKVLRETEGGGAHVEDVQYESQCDLRGVVSYAKDNRDGTSKPVVRIEEGTTNYSWHYTHVVTYHLIEGETIKRGLVRSAFNKLLLSYKEVSAKNESSQADYLADKIGPKWSGVSYACVEYSELPFGFNGEIEDALQEGLEFEGLGGDEIPDSAWLRGGPKGLNNINRQKISPDDVRELRGKLGGGPAINTYNELLLGAMKRLRDHEYKISIVESETAFETAITGFIFKFLREKGKSRDEIEKLLKDISLPNSDSYCGIENRIDRFDDLVESWSEHFNLDFTKFGGTAERRDWKSDTYDLRNKIVHRGRGANEEEALDAFESSQKAIRKVEQVAEPILRAFQ